MTSATDEVQIDGFATEEFTFGGKTRRVFVAGEGPAVIVIEELPGITPAVIGFARKVVDAGFTVVMPELFGKTGAEATPGVLAQAAIPACVSKEFRAFALRTTPPAIDWLRALARDAHSRCGGPGVGAVGMCFTGGFALAMATEPEMLAPVLSQPSLPIGGGKKRGADLGLSDRDLLAVKERAEADDICVLGLRFTGDRLVPAARFASLRRELGDNFIGVEIDSSPGNPWGHRKAAHSVLTEDLIDEPGQPTRDALEQVLRFFQERLQVAPA
ncbi:dienelactone hydrolase family protein [Dermatobacter hominis]|uniref:dienelactone hydrolase family protein n=1 Tax=Dermatobacter hominis TaxID=2884263 RepID=UPI001D102C32|nr:dienelactone hydrolase family protein [Dermatobacter hominis]UDY37989.1 dienelactone hydrolase family protein [Dermatobacter hominis]